MNDQERELEKETKRLLAESPRFEANIQYGNKQALEKALRNENLPMTHLSNSLKKQLFYHKTKLKYARLIQILKALKKEQKIEQTRKELKKVGIINRIRSIRRDGTWAQKPQLYSRHLTPHMILSIANGAHIVYKHPQYGYIVRKK